MDLAAAIETLKRHDSADVRRIGGVLEDRLAGRIRNVDHALGLGRAIATVEFDERDRLLAACAELVCFTGLSAHAIALTIEAYWARYDAGPGVRERGLAECPRHRVGTPSEFFWHLARSGFAPLKYRRLLKILLQSFSREVAVSRHACCASIEVDARKRRPK